MAEVSHEKATPEAVAHIAAHLRQADLDELRAYGVFGAMDEQLRMHVEDWGRESSTRVALVDGEPAVIYGLKPPSSEETEAGFGWSPWALMTKTMERYPLTLHREAVRVLEDWRDDVPLMDNFIWEKNEVGMAWLRRLGFYFDPRPYRFQPKGAVFRRFTWRTLVCARLQSPRLSA